MQAGETIAGKYRLNRVLGMGGMATVWSVTNVFTEREFAIKFMLPQVARTPEAARRFLLEAKVSARINHPNIIEVIDVGQTDEGALFLVMELLTGQSLDVAMRRQQPPMLLVDFLAVMRDVAEALAAAHRSGVVHRDLKPSNVFLHRDRDGREAPKILDFGVSKILEEEQNSGLTDVGAIIGSPLYMSPEQAAGADGIDGRTDIFAFGAILFEALTGRRAFEAPNFHALIVKIATQQPESIDALAPQLPEALRALVRECLVTSKDKRLASFDDIVDRIATLLLILEGLDLRLASPHRVAPPPDPDATNALPLGRPAASDHPPPSTKPPSLPALPPPTEAPRLPPTARRPIEVVLVAMHDLGTLVRRLPPRTLAVATAASGLMVLLVLVLGVVSLARGCGSSETAQAMPRASAEASARPAPVVASSASAEIPSADEDVPVVSVDSLPSAGRSTSKGSSRRVPKGRGSAQPP
jgi:serine/threonine-protein kinase